MCHQQVLFEAVMFDNGLNLITNLFFAEGLVCDPEAHGHDLDGDDADLVIKPTTLNTRGRVEVSEEIDVGVEADTNSMDEDDGKFGTGSVRTMPVCEMLDGRSLAAE